MTTLLPAERSLRFDRTIDIQAPRRLVWESLLEEIGPGCKGEDGRPMGMKLEPWPGGRLYRDLGGNAGHLWGHVQVIKPPALLELAGPLFMSYAAVNHVQYRLTENGGGTLLKLVHTAFGDLDPTLREGVAIGWGETLENVRKAAEGS